MMLLELENVTKLYGKVIGVNDITISLPTGAYGLLGPNGSGKSTLLNLLTGQLKPTLGSLKILGKQPRNNAAVYRQIGYCPSSEGMYTNVCALEWVTYLTQLYGFSRPDATSAAHRALDSVGLGDAKHRPISTYSRGMRQRTKLAQAIAHDPQLLILDEPFNGLDPLGRHEIAETLHEWIAQGKSLILASHILFEVESLTSSFLLISGGRLLASGTASEVLDMLTDVPSEFSIGTSDPHRLASLLIEKQVVDSVQLEASCLRVMTRSGNDLVSQLPVLVREHQLVIDELGSADESLQSLFTSLMKIHRGEA